MLKTIEDFLVYFDTFPIIKETYKITNNQNTEEW